MEMMLKAVHEDIKKNHADLETYKVEITETVEVVEKAKSRRTPVSLGCVDLFVK